MEDFVMSEHLKKLGFKMRDGSVAGCNTIPCLHGKMPYQKGPTVPCVIIQSMCSLSPVEMMEENNEAER